MGSKLTARLKYGAFLLVVVAICDVLVLRGLLGFGYPHGRDDAAQRVPAPYVEFRGAANTLDHNAHGFRGPEAARARPGDLRVAFFGGSTGYNGSPPVPETLRDALAAALDTPVFVANFSVVSSNHRQHLHAMLEYLPQFRPDVVVFYGGFNETVQSAYHDPRLGYPFNYYYRAETSPLTRVLVRHSAIMGELDRRFGWFSGVGRLRAELEPFSDDWNDAIVDHYFRTLDLAGDVAAALAADRCGRTRFVGFYQPYRVPDRFAPTHRRIRDGVAADPALFDLSGALPAAPDPFTDLVHVRQPARETIGRAMAEILLGELADGVLAGCRVESRLHVAGRPAASTGS